MFVVGIAIILEEFSVPHTYNSIHTSLSSNNSVFPIIDHNVVDVHYVNIIHHYDDVHDDNKGNDDSNDIPTAQ